MSRITLMVMGLVWIAALVACEKKTEDASEKSENQATSESQDPVDRVCANLKEVIGEPIDRCKAEMPAFREQCPEQIDATLECMAEVKSEQEFLGCAEACMQAGAEEIAPPVPEELDTPELRETCKVFGEKIGGGTPAGQEACRRKLANQIQQCPEYAGTFLNCYKEADSDEEWEDCITECVEASVQSGAKDK